MHKRTEQRVQTQVNLQKLLLSGRLKLADLDPKTSMPKMPRRNVLYEVKLKGTNRMIEANGGHAKAEGSVWRIALAGPARYIWKIMRDEANYRVYGKRSISAPPLMPEEMIEARQFVTFVLDARKEQKSIVPDDFLSDKYDDKKTELFGEMNKKFYKWLGKSEKIELARLTDIFAFLPV